MKIFKLMMVALVAMCGLNSCSDDCDHDVIDVDYSKSIVGVWSSESESYEEGIRFYDDGKFIAFGNKGEGDFYVEGTWTLKQNRLLLTTNEGETHFSGIIEVYAEDVMLMTSDGSKKLCENYLRLPLTPMEPQHEAVLLQCMRDNGLKV